MAALTQAQLRDPAWRRLLALHFGWVRSLSPALEGDLSAFRMLFEPLAQPAPALLAPNGGERG